MRTKEVYIRKILDFYSNYKNSDEEIAKAMYRTSIESILWTLGSQRTSYLKNIIDGGGRYSDQPFEDYMDLFEYQGDLKVFNLKYDEVKKMKMSVVE